MVELNGALSNPPLTDEGGLPSLLKLYQELQEKNRLHPKKPAPPKWRPGEISKTIYDVLDKSMEPMRSKDIHAAVEDKLQRPISISTVRAELSVHCKDKQSKFIKLRHGAYMVRPPA